LENCEGKEFTIIQETDFSSNGEFGFHYLGMQDPPFYLKKLHYQGVLWQLNSNVHFYTT